MRSTETTLLIVGGVEHDHALRRAAGDADAVDRRADELAAVGDQHELVGLFHRERRDELADLLLDRLLALLASQIAMATRPLPPRPVIRYS